MFTPHGAPGVSHLFIIIIFDGFNSEDIFCFYSIFISKNFFAKVQELFMSPME